nr:multicopper oxidase family protein [Nitrosomonas nitrosa]
MRHISSRSIGRREFLTAGSAAALAAALPLSASWAGVQLIERRLVAQPNRVNITGSQYPDTAVWAYDGAIPGPEIRLRQGQRLRVEIENRLPQATTIHWHGVRVPNAMDGVPHLTQAPIEPGARFVYEFDAVDAGTFWYHPHERSFEQVGRGLYGSLIVEEREPIAVDRDVTWVLGDWRLQPDAQLREDFGSFFDASHNGRVGNTVTINGRVFDTFAMRSGERIRLRVINTANARIFGLDFRGHRPWIIALDGQPVEPHAPDGGRVTLGPAMRADLILDCTGKPGERFQVIDDFYKSLAYRLVDLAYADAAPLRSAPPETSIKLPPNPLAEPDLNSAARHRIEFMGGMMGGMSAAMYGGKRVSARELMMQHRMAWAINGVVAQGHVHDPLVTLDRGKSYVLDMINDTAWHHPIHLHGHSFRVIARDGKPTLHREWQDTVLMKPRERVEIALVADNPGNWMIHCHILEHQAAGMMGVIRVA